MKTSRCESCNAEVIWTETVNGKKMAVDAEPVENGNLRVFESEGRVLSRYSFKDEEGPHYQAHFASCPDAEKWRKA